MARTALSNDELGYDEHYKAKQPIAEGHNLDDEPELSSRI